jgi:TonB family protein
MDRLEKRAEYRVVLLDEIQPASDNWERAALGTAVIHLILILGLIAVPRSFEEPVPTRDIPHRVTPLVDPPTRLTQKAPNRKPLTTEISVAPVAPSPRVAPVTQKKFQAPPTAQVARKQSAAPAVPQEPPKIVAAQPQQTVQITPPAVLTPPLPRTPEQPKIVLENPPAPPQSGQGTGRLKVPGGGIEEAIREISKSGPRNSRSVGDDTDGDTSPGINPVRPGSGRPKSSVELVSDPNGVDMRAYLLQVLQNVRRNWAVIYPEGARLGLRGRVVIQFAVTPQGKIQKVVFISESGKQALDRAGVAALSMSDPLPAPPAEFKGDRVVMQFTFLYNAVR